MEGTEWGGRGGQATAQTGQLVGNLVQEFSRQGLEGGYGGAGSVSLWMGRQLVGNHAQEARREGL